MADELNKERGQQDGKEAVVGDSGGTTMEVSRDKVGQADTKYALRLDEQTMGPVGWRDEGEGGTEEEVYIFGLSAIKKYFHVCTESYWSKA